MSKGPDSAERNIARREGKLRQTLKDPDVLFRQAFWRNDAGTCRILPKGEIPRRREEKVPLNGIGPKRHPAPKWRNSAKRDSSTIGESRQNGKFPPLGESSPQNGSIPPFGKAKNAGKSRRFCSVKQKSVPFWRNHHSRTRLLCVLTQNSVKTVSLMGRTAKIAQNALFFAVWPITHKTESPPLAESLPKSPQKPSANSPPSAKFHHPMGPKGVSFPSQKNGTSPKRRQGESLPTGSKIKPSTPQIVRITKPQGGKGDSIHH